MNCLFEHIQLKNINVSNYMLNKYKVLDGAADTFHLRLDED